MTDQNKQADNEKANELKSKATSFYSMLSNKFEVLSELPNKQLPMWYGAVFLVIIFFVIAWKQISVSRMESEMAKQLASERVLITQEAREYADKQYVKEEERFGQVLAWAVRGELIRSNLDQVDQYLNELVKMKDTDRVVLVSEEGKLLVSTDKRLEDENVANLYPQEILKPDNITVVTNVDDKKLLVVPVMGLNSRIATIVVSYNPPALKF
jgi:hypothetical protein